MKGNHLSFPLVCLTWLLTGCVVDVTEVPTDIMDRQCVTNVESGQVSCFGTFTDAIIFATQGQVTDAPADPGVAAIDANLQTRLNALADRPDQITPRTTERLARSEPTVVVGIEYSDINFQGRTMVYTASHGCDGNHQTADFGSPFLQGANRNTISSFSGYSRCAEQLYENIDYGGARTPIATSMRYVGNAMNDRTSSIKWF